MTDKHNQTPERSDADCKLNGDAVPEAVSPDGGSQVAGPSSGMSSPSAGKKAWELFLRCLDLLHREEPAPPADDKPKTGFGKRWAEFNAFLDSLDEVENAPEEQEKPLKERIRDFKDRLHAPECRKAMLRTFGGVCRTVCCRALVAVFLFFLTMGGVIWAMRFFEKHHVPFYPTDRQMVEYLIDEHESIEAAAYEMTTMAGKDENIPVERFGAEFTEKLKPVGAYSDEYGVYIVTSKDWYSGEHGIFIARDNNNMPPMLSWGLIDGRIYAYTHFTE